MTFEPSMILAVLPEICVLVLLAIVMVVDLLWPKGKKIPLGWITAAGLIVTALLTVFLSPPPATPRLIWGGMLRQDGASYVFQLIFLTGAALTALFSIDSDALGQRGEFFALMLVSTLGMMLMASAADLILLYLAIETTSIPLYIMAGFLTRNQKSVEAGIKYLLFGAMTSAVMLYGFSLLYGFSGTTQIYQIAASLKAGQLPIFVTVTAIMLVLVGFGFKISAAPFHFWAPDVYEGAPTPVAGFLSTASKAAGFAVLLRVLLVAFPDTAAVWTIIIALLSIASMIVGNFLALAQKNIKRLLAYSSIAQAGYILIGVAANSQLGSSAAVYYLGSYLVTNLAAFGIVTLVGHVIGSDEISAYAGLSRRSPGLALALLVSLLSLAGVPPFGGFAGKLFVFASAIDSHLVWLAIIGIINSVVGLYYYLVVLKVVYLHRSEDEAKPIHFSRSWSTAIVLCVLGIILLGTVFAPWFGLSNGAATALLTN
ncbi:MAG: NADH-quinone oxidoreductase subunit N [Anaerolineaceae bacterium]|nr:NADH-quinone oxidoreductase subunit N [Anaerolineaceae bacterium]